MRKTHHGEEGFLLIAVLFLLALLLFALATAAPRVTQDLRRDREQETIHRGMQYARAIQLYYRKFGHYPVSIDELLSSNNMRFLRRKYVDPMTGKDDWRLIHVGQAKTMRGGAPNQVGTPAAQAGLGGASPTDPSSPFSQPGANSGFGPSAGTGAQGGQAPGGIVVGGSPGGLGNPAQGPGSAGGADQSASGQPGSATGPLSSIGAGPIVGVSSTNPASSIRVLKKMEHYKDWEFIYDPSLDLGGAGGANGLQPGAPGGQPNLSPNQPGAPPGGGLTAIPPPGQNPPNSPNSPQ